MNDQGGGNDRGQGDQPTAAESASDLLLGRLRSIVLEPYEARMDDVERFMAEVRSELEELRSGALEARKVGEVLPAAIAARGKDDKKLALAMSPLVEDALQQSVKRNPQPLVDVIFPIVGPAIRKAIATAMRGLVASVNRTVESTFTPRGVKWRLEAWRTGRSYAEVVLKHTLLYRVEGAYLIHNESGLLLQHAIAPEVEVQRPELVTSMLTAIQDFARDSFSPSGNESLEQFRVGDLTVLVESGPHAALALAVRGVAAPELRAHAQVALETVHADFHRELQEFDGQSAPFEASQPTLEECLRDEEKEAKRFPAARLAFGTALLVAVVLVAINWIAGRVEAKHWTAYVERLQQQPGLMVVHSEERDGGYRLVGLRDPLAPDPWAMLADHGISRADVSARWEYFRAEHPDYVLLRASQVLRPPAGVELKLVDRTLSAHGAAPGDWTRQAERLALLVPGVAQWDGRGVTDERLALFREPIAAVEEMRLSIADDAPDGDPSLREGARVLTLRLIALDAQADRAGAKVLVRLVVCAGENEGDWKRAARVRAVLMEKPWKATLIKVVSETTPEKSDHTLRVQAQVQFARSLALTDG